VASTSQDIDELKETFNDLIANIYETFKFAGFTAPPSFIHLEDDIDEND